NGVEGGSEAAPLAATPVSDRLCPTVSHPPGLEASPTGRPPTARGSAVGSPAVDPGHDGHDLGGGGLPTRAVRDGPRVLRGLLRGPQGPRHAPRGVSEGAGPHPDAATPRGGRGGAAGDPRPVRPPALGRWLRADGLRRFPHRGPAHHGTGGPPRPS